MVEQRPHRVQEIPVRPHPVDRAERNDDSEGRFQHDPELEEIERVGRQVVGERDVTGERLPIDSEVLRDERAHALLHRASDWRCLTAPERSATHLRGPLRPRW